MEREKVNIKVSFPKFVVGNLPLSKLLLKEEKQPCFNRKVEDPRQESSGMTPSFMGFTLIELLVVVLIIGILAAVAVPQYQMAVAKSRAANLVTMANAVIQAEERYFLANGTYTNKWDELDISFPGTVSGSTLAVTGGKIWIALSLNNGSNPDAVQVVDSRLPNMYLYWGYQNTKFGSWANWRTCYAETNKTAANQLCQHITNTKTGQNSGGSYKVYTFR